MTVIRAPPAGADPVRLFNSVLWRRGRRVPRRFIEIEVFHHEDFHPGSAAWWMLQHRSLPVNAVWTPQGEASWSIALRAGVLTEFFDIVP
jgi:hypothetical protein